MGRPVAAVPEKRLNWYRWLQGRTSSFPKRNTHTHTHTHTCTHPTDLLFIFVSLMAAPSLTLIVSTQSRDHRNNIAQQSSTNNIPFMLYYHLIFILFYYHLILIIFYYYFIFIIYLLYSLSYVIFYMI